MRTHATAPRLTVHQIWSTLHIPPSRRAEFWRGAVCEAFLAMTPRISSHADFAARLEHTALERLALNRVSAPAHGVLRTRHDLARGGSGLFFVNLHPTGRCRVQQGGKDHRAEAGELMLIDSREPYTIDVLDAGALLSLAVPADMLKAWVPDVEDRTATPVSPSPAMQLLRAQMQTLAQCAPDVSAELAGVLADTTLSLARAALAPQAEAAAQQTSLRRRAQVLIARHAHDAGFGPIQAAALLQVSVRSLHAAMAADGTTFGKTLMEHRLVRARAQLLQPHAPLKVAELARALGFVSAEHFSRRYRARFGCAPSNCLPHSPH